jgi:hypothetical protein
LRCWRNLLLLLLCLCQGTQLLLHLFQLLQDPLLLLIMLHLSTQQLTPTTILLLLLLPAVRCRLLPRAAACRSCCCCACRPHAPHELPEACVYGGGVLLQHGRHCICECLAFAGL